MSEEEKEAIKWFDTERKLVEITNGDNNYFSIILNLIDKLQKENEELKSKCNSFYGMSATNFISKDKIRDKIKEVAEELQIYVDTEKFDIEFEKSNYTIKVLEELLERN